MEFLTLYEELYSVGIENIKLEAERDALIEENKKLKEENSKLETQKIALARSYKQVIEENNMEDEWYGVWNG